MFFCFFFFAKRNPYQRIISRQKTRRLGSFNKSRMINENDKLQKAIVDGKITVLFGLQAIISFPLWCVDFRLKIHLVNDPPNIPQNTGYIKLFFQFFKIYLSFFFIWLHEIFEEDFIAEAFKNSSAIKIFMLNKTIPEHNDPPVTEIFEKVEINT